MNNFSYSSVKTFVLGAQKNHLIESDRDDPAMSNLLPIHHSCQNDHLFYRTCLMLNSVIIV